MPVGMKITGTAQVESALRSMGDKAQVKFLRAALREGAKPVAARASSDAPTKSGLLSSSIKINNGTTKAGTVTVRISPSKAVLTRGGKYYYATSIEGGFFMGKRLPKVTKGFLGNHRFYSKEQYRKASVKAGRKFVPGTQWMEHVYTATKTEAEQIIEEKLVEQVQEEWKA